MRMWGSQNSIYLFFSSWWCRGTEPRASCKLGKCSTIELHPQPCARTLIYFRQVYKWYNSFENLSGSFLLSQTYMVIFMIQPGHPTPRSSPKKNSRPYKDFYIHVHSSSTYNSPNLEISNPSLNGWTNYSVSIQWNTSLQ
jgi:hypothetical protein